MNNQKETTRHLQQQGPGQLNNRLDFGMISCVANTRVSGNHHETSDDYTGLVARLNERWRVIDCKDAILWILQRRDALRSGQPRWRAVGYVRTKKALIRVSRTLCGPFGAEAERIILALPERIGGAA